MVGFLFVFLFGFSFVFGFFGVVYCFVLFCLFWGGFVCVGFFFGLFRFGFWGGFFICFVGFFFFCLYFGLVWFGLVGRFLVFFLFVVVASFTLAFYPGSFYQCCFLLLSLASPFSFFLFHFAFHSIFHSVVRREIGRYFVPKIEGLETQGFTEADRIIYCR